MRSLDKSRQNESIVAEIPIYPHLKKITLCLDFFKPQIMFDRSLGLCSYWSLESLILSDLHRHSVGITFFVRQRVFVDHILPVPMLGICFGEKRVFSEENESCARDVLHVFNIHLLEERFLSF